MSKLQSRNIFFGLSTAKKREAFQVLRKGKGFKIERIVSCGQATPGGKWLCSKTAEWVIVLRGRARLLFKGACDKLDLRIGDLCVHFGQYLPPRGLDPSQAEDRVVSRSYLLLNIRIGS